MLHDFTVKIFQKNMNFSTHAKQDQNTSKGIWLNLFDTTDYRLATLFIYFSN